MKSLLLILLCLPLIGLGQLTYVPDDNFEGYLEFYGMGNGIPNDDNVFTSAIDTVHSLYIYGFRISDLTGIEDFAALTSLNCNSQLTSLDVSQNTALTNLSCASNQLTNLDVTQNTALTKLDCSFNQLKSLDVSNNTALTFLNCSNNQLKSLDVSQNTALTVLGCRYNEFATLDVRNGNNTNFTQFSVSYNPNLTCINVDDAAWSTVNWIYNELRVERVVMDEQHFFSEYCGVK